MGVKQKQELEELKAENIKLKKEIEVLNNELERYRKKKAKMKGVIIRNRIEGYNKAHAKNTEKLRKLIQSGITNKAELCRQLGFKSRTPLDKYKKVFEEFADLFKNKNKRKLEQDNNLQFDTNLNEILNETKPDLKIIERVQAELAPTPNYANTEKPKIKKTEKPKLTIESDLGIDNALPMEE